MKLILFLTLFSNFFVLGQDNDLLKEGSVRVVQLIRQENSTRRYPDALPSLLKMLNEQSTARFDIDNSTLANSQAIYDSLMNYDVFFIKGGNQWDYYNTWNDTKVEDAIHDKFNQGGVIMGTSAGMAILSEVIFTAENGTVYPDDALTDPYNWIDIALDDDFLGIFHIKN